MNHYNTLNLIIPVIACVALAFLLTPLCQYICGGGAGASRVSCGCCGRYSAAELAAFGLSLAIVTVWILTGHWLLMDGKWHINPALLHRISLKIQPQLYNGTTEPYLLLCPEQLEL